MRPSKTKTPRTRNERVASEVFIRSKEEADGDSLIQDRWLKLADRILQAKPGRPKPTWKAGDR